MSETPRSVGIELGQLAELQLLDHLAREIARQRELHLAGHRLLIDRALTIHRVLFGVRADEDVLASLDQDPGFGLVFRRDQIDADEGQRRDRDGGAEHPPPLARQRAADGAEIELAVSRVVHHHAALFTHRQLQLYATRRPRGPSQTIKVAVALIRGSRMCVGEGLLTM